MNVQQVIEQLKKAKPDILVELFTELPLETLGILSRDPAFLPSIQKSLKVKISKIEKDVERSLEKYHQAQNSTQMTQNLKRAVQNAVHLLELSEKIRNQFQGVISQQKYNQIRQRWQYLL